MEAARRIQGIAMIAAALACALPMTSLHAQSLHGSHASVDLMYDAAESHGLRFFHTAAELAQAAQSGALVPVMPTADVMVAGASFPLALPGTYQFIQRLAPEYVASCGDALTVTSAARPAARHLRNGSPKSVHPTGMAIDIRKPRSSACLKWIRGRLLDLEGRGAIEATEEFHPPHFHVAVLPGWEKHMPPMPQMASATGDVETASRLASLSGWPLTMGGIGASPNTVGAGPALLALAGVVAMIPSVAAMAGPLTLQLAAPIAFASPSGPMLVASRPLEELHQPGMTLTGATMLAAAQRPATDTAAITAPGGTAVAVAPGDSGSRTEATAEGEVADAGGKYRVRPGDSLWEIAREHETSVKAIVSLNNLRSRRLMPGQTLALPDGGS